MPIMTLCHRNLVLIRGLYLRRLIVCVPDQLFIRLFNYYLFPCLQQATVLEHFELPFPGLCLELCAFLFHVLPNLGGHLRIKRRQASKDFGPARLGDVLGHIDLGRSR
jgi:hypothetical protein